MSKSKNKSVVTLVPKLQDNSNSNKNINWKEHKDELLESLSYYAQMQRWYYGELIKEGFTEEQSVRLISTYHPLKPS